MNTAAQRGRLQILGGKKWFDETEVIKGVDLDIAAGEFIVFVGPSGCGKSTLLRMIAGLEDVSGGRIMLDGDDITGKPPADRRLAMVFQSYALYPHLTVRGNLGFSLKMAGADAAVIEQKIRHAARVLHLEELLERMPRQLSGGQRQRVAIGRAIVREPLAFLFDEPLSNLDAALRVEMRFELAKLHETLGATMIYVTHDQIEAMTLADKIVALRDGRIEQIGSPRDLYECPVNRFVAEFIGSPKMNILPLPAAAASLRAAPPPQAAALGIRAEHIALAAPEVADCSGTIALTEYLGGDVFIYVDCAAGMLTVRLPANAAARAGDAAHLRFADGMTHYFDAQQRRILPCD